MKRSHVITNGYYWLDETARASFRLLARRVSRRSFLGRLGAMLVGAAALPLLPVARAFAQETPTELGDSKTCEYWRYCALGGTLCACCGGTHKTCPPGAEASPITWVGTCRNGADERDYLISYNDCCGKAVCSRCGCNRTERDKPVYFPSNSNNILWCFGTQARTYHCTVAVVLGEAPEAD